MKTTTKTVKILGYLGLPATILTGLEACFSHYQLSTPNHTEDSEYFKYVPLRNLTIEHFSIVTGFPFYVAGSLQIYLMLKSDSDILMCYLLFLVFLTLTLIKLIQLKKE